MTRTKVDRISFWQVAGPFDNPVRDGKRVGVDVAYPPEAGPVDIDTTYAGKDGVSIAWQELTQQPNGFYELGFTVPETRAIAYAFSLLHTRKAGTADLRFAPYHGLKIFVNGREIGMVPPGDYDPLGAPVTFPAVLRKGRNELLVKCERDTAGGWGFFFGARTERPMLSEYFRLEAAERARHFTRPPAGRQQLRRWQKQVRVELVRLMAFPEPVKTVVRETEQTDCGVYIRHRLYIRTERNWEVPANLLVPKGLCRDRSTHALMCLHGHGHGKSDITQDFDFPKMGNGARETEYDFGRLFAEAGYVVMTPDSRAFGELGDVSCTAAYALANGIGRPLVGMRVWDAMRALDVLLTRPEVDPARVGCTGMSWGGTHTAYLTMVDPRIKAALVGGYFSDFADMLYRTPVCPCQYLPGVVHNHDFQDLLFGLVAPRPLYIQNGELDTLYTPAHARAAFRQGKQLYTKLGIPENAVLEMTEMGHQYRFATARAWLDRVL